MFHNSGLSFATYLLMNKSFQDATVRSTNGNYKYWLLLMFTVPLITMVGNLMVVISVYHERNLRNTTNYFIVSLAVADINLSILVMPISIWIEINNGFWNLGIFVCDAFIVADVTFCTASIINLTAISIDRYVAVMMPLKYSQHQGCSKIFLKITMTWLISFAIALPMAFGLNHRVNLPYIDKCTFNNADFIIWSSIGSFYIPSVVTIYLYFQIFKKIRERANCKNPLKSFDIYGQNKNNFISKKKVKKEKRNTNKRPSMDTGRHICPSQHIFDKCYSNFEFQNMYDSINSLASLNNFPKDTIKHSNTTETKFSLLSNISEPSHSLLTKNSEKILTKKHNFNYENSIDLFEFSEKTSSLHDGFKDMKEFRLHLKNRIKLAKKVKGPLIFGIPTIIQTKMYRLHEKRILKKIQHKSNKREKKAIKTLFIVLAVFLVCWAPYFAVNLSIGIAVKFKYSNLRKLLEPCYATVTWFGYINSFLNPIIYTTFNVEFRNAFKKIITCK